MKIKIFKNIADINFNFEKFQTQTNILLVTGLSGSGKSFLAEQLSRKYEAICFQPEWLIHSKHVSPQCKHILDSFINLHPEIKPYVENKWNNEKCEDKNPLLKRYLNLFFQHFFQNTEPDKLYIVEGLQIFSILEFDLIKGYPIIIKGTSSINSLKNRLRRDLAKPKNKKLSAKTKYFFKAIAQSRLYQFKHRKVLNKFLKQYL